MPAVWLSSAESHEEATPKKEIHNFILSGELPGAEAPHAAAQPARADSVGEHGGTSVVSRATGVAEAEPK